MISWNSTTPIFVLPANVRVYGARNSCLVSNAAYGEVHVLPDVLINFSISALVVFAFEKLRLPTGAGFLVSGTVVGPHGLNLISDLHQVETLPEIGVVLLLFIIGLETSLTQLRASSRNASGHPDQNEELCDHRGIWIKWSQFCPSLRRYGISLCGAERQH